MMTLIAAALAAAQPAASAAEPMGQMPKMQMGQTHMGQSADHKAMDCCKQGCKDMAGKHDGDTGEQPGHAAH